MIHEIKTKYLPCDNPIPINYSEIPVYEKEDYEHRIQKLKNLMRTHKYSHLVIYGDKEHFSNLHYLTGLDPRFEEVLLVIQEDSKPILIVGNECYDYTSKVKIDVDVELCHIFSLPGQPDRSNKTLSETFKGIGFNKASKVGVIGWKKYPHDQFELKSDIFDLPHYIIETLCLYTSIDNLKNATDLFTDINYGLNHHLTAKEIIHFELSGTKASRSVYNVLKHLEVGMSEIEASTYFMLDGDPQTVHPLLSFGDSNVPLGIASPTYNTKLMMGDPMGVGIGPRGAMVHRAGMYVNSKEDIPKGKEHYMNDFLKPYYSSIAGWYEAIKIGNTYGAVYDAVESKLGIEEFGITLNPGHLINTYEWTNSPFNKGEKAVIKSGTAIQCDYTVSFVKPFMSAHVEDGLVVADNELIKEIKRMSPSCYERIEKRRKFMKDVLNINIGEEILPMSDLCGICFPYLGDLRTILSFK